MIYTSYFAKYKGEAGVAICKYMPKWELKYPIEWYPQLAPTAEILINWKSSKQDKAAEAEYTEAYKRDVLSKLDVNKVYEELDGKVLLCYERPDQFCHRHIVAEWFRDAGYMCNELQYIKVPDDFEKQFM